MLSIGDGDFEMLAVHDMDLIPGDVAPQDGWRKKSVQPRPATQRPCSDRIAGAAGEWCCFVACLLVVSSCWLLLGCSLPWAYRLGLIETEGGFLPLLLRGLVCIELED